MENYNNFNYCFFRTIPRSSNPTISASVPIGRSSGVATLGKNPEILSLESSSNSITAHAYGANSSNPSGGTVIIVYVTIFPFPEITESSKHLLPHFLQKYTVARCNSPQLVHFLARTFPFLAFSINSGFADNLHTLENMNCTTCASSTKILC